MRVSPSSSFSYTTAMNHTAWLALAASVISSIGGLAGGLLLLVVDSTRAHRMSRMLIGFASGALLGVAFLDLLPETMEQFTEPHIALRYVLFGIIGFFLIERILAATHQHQDDFEHEDDGSAMLQRAVPLAIIGDAVHNFLDGIVVAAAFLIDVPVGIATAISVLLHELPHEIADFTIMLRSGMTRKKVLWINLSSALIAPLGTIIAISLANIVESVEAPLVAIAAGNLIYLALSNLVPHLHHERNHRAAFVQVLLMLVGMSLFFFLPGHAGH